jgi:hypothetical protein
MKLDHRAPDATSPVTLAAMLELARRDLATREPPAELLDAVQRRGRAVVPPARAGEARPPMARAPTSRRWAAALVAWSGALTCAVVLLGSALLMLLPPRDAPGALDARAGPFMPLVPAERWAEVGRGHEAEAGWLLATELPAERLATLGLPFDPAHAGDSVRAELLVHPSGEVLALRLLR